MHSPSSSIPLPGPFIGPALVNARRERGSCVDAGEHSDLIEGFVTDITPLRQKENEIVLETSITEDDNIRIAVNDRGTGVSTEVSNMNHESTVTVVDDDEGVVCIVWMGLHRRRFSSRNQIREK